MKKFLSYFSIAFLLALGLFFLNKSEAFRYTPYQGNTGIDVQNYKIEILNINRDTRAIDFKTTITAKAISNFNSGERFGLDFVDTYQISEVLFNEQSISSGNYRISYTGSVSLSGTNKRLEINLPSNVSTSGDIIVKVTYSGIPKFDIDNSGLGFYSTGTELHAFNEPLGAHQWFPCNDVPWDKATLDFYTTTLTGKVILGNGKLMYDTNNGNGTHTVYRKEYYPISTYNVYVGVGPFTYVYSGTSPFLSGTRNIIGFSKTSNTSLSTNIKDLSTSTGLLFKMIDVLGAYPYQQDEKLGFVMRPINMRMEHNTMIGLYSLSPVIFRHEIVHQWMGNYVSHHTWPDIWVTEGAATYFASVVNVGKANRKTATNELSRTQEWNRKLNDPSATNLFQSTLVYDRGARIYHHLRSYLGDSLFFSGLTYYINKYAYSTVTTQQFQQTREEASNLNLSGFFNRFVYGTGNPLLRVTSFYDNINDGSFSGRAFFKLSRADNKARTPDVIFAEINYTDGSSGEVRIFQENQNSYVTINTSKAITNIVVDAGSGTIGRKSDYPGLLYKSGYLVQDDSDSDSLPDGREYIMFSNLSQTANGDYDNDGILNIDEYDLNVASNDQTGPNFDFSNNNGYECNAGYLIISGAQDTGVGLHNIPYSFDGTNRGTSNILDISSQRDVGSIIITGYVRDGSGNITSKTATYSFDDIYVNADNFTGSDNVGSGIINVNWKTISNANEGICGTGDVIGDSIYQQGSKGTCTLSGDILTYIADPDQIGSDMCVISVIDNEGTGFGDQVEVYLGGIDTTSQQNNTTPELTVGTINSGNTATSGAGQEYFYNGIINISSNISDTIQINSGTCEYSLDGTSRLVANYTGTSTAGTCYKNNLNPQSDIEIFFRVKNINGNTGESLSMFYTYDNQGPSFQFNNNSGYECVAGTLSINLLEDLGVGFSNNAYSFDGLSWNSSNDLNINGQQPGSIVKTGYVKDSLGNQTIQTATYTFNNVGISANNFTGSSDVGNSVRTGNRKILSNASEFWCGSGSVVNSGISTQASKGTCSVSGEIITYTPSSNKTGNDSCIIRMRDNENTQGLSTVYRWGIDTLAPNAVVCTNSQNFDTSINVSCTSSEGIIKYTNDGSNPTCNSSTRSNQAYEQTTTIKTIACDSYNNASSINTYIYTLNINQVNTGSMSWTGLTPQMGEIITTTGVNISLDIHDNNLENFNRNMNGENFDVYNNNLVFMTNANNISELGENNTTLTDISNYGNHGSITGATWTGGGREGNSLFFRGGSTNDRVIITDNNSLDMTTGFTMSAWIKPTSHVGDGIIIAKPHTSFVSPYIDYGLGFSSSSMRAFQIGVGGGSIQRYCNSHTGSAITGTFTHVVGVFNYNSLKIYINGSLSNTCTFTGMTLNNVNTPLYLGYYPYGGGGAYNFKGRLDDIMLYNKALDINQIQVLYKMNFNKYGLNDRGFKINYNGLLAGNYSYTGFAQSIGGYQYWLNRDFVVYDDNDLVVLPSTSDSQSIVNEFLNKGYTQNNGELSGSKGILLKNPNGMIKTNLNIKNNGNKIYIPNNVTLRKKSNLSNFNGVINPPTDITVSNLDDVIKAIRVGSANESLNLNGGVATITIPAPGKNNGDPISIYYSEDNGTTWNFHANDTVELIGGQPSVEFTTDHFTDFVVTLPGGTFTGTFTINSDNNSTTLTGVTLDISTTPTATQMRFSNDNSTRSNREPYSTSTGWILSSNYEAKTVYAQFDFGGGNIISTSDTINYLDPNGGGNNGGGSCVGGGPGTACLSLEIMAVTGECRYGQNLDLGDHAQQYSTFIMTGAFIGNNNTYPLRWSCNDTAGKSPINRDMQISSTDLIATGAGGNQYIISSDQIEIKSDISKVYQGDASVFTGEIGSFLDWGANLTIPKIIFKKTSPQGTVGELGTDSVDLRVIVPANQEIGQYQATITIAFPQM